MEGGERKEKRKCQQQQVQVPGQYLQQFQQILQQQPPNTTKSNQFINKYCCIHGRCNHYRTGC
eukprot:1000994-Ditylum_brightwellii.AAC.1